MDLRKLISDNLPGILTSMAVTGVITTTVVAVRATPAALRDIWDAEQDVTVDDLRSNTRRALDRVQVAWHHYVPAAVIGGMTIAAVIGAHSISTKRQVAIAGLYSLTERAYHEYKEKVIDQIGQNKEKVIRDEIAREHIEQNPISSQEIIITGTGKHLCYDSITGRYFESDIESIRRAVNDINAKCLNDMYAEQNDFYRLIGLPITPYGAEIGWRFDHLLEIDFSSHLAEDGRPCLSLDYRVEPIRGYYKINR